MSLIDQRLRELHNSVDLAAEVSVEPRTIPDWWRSLSDGGRRNYLVRHPKSKYRNVEVREAISKMDTKQRDKLGRFLTKLTGPKGMLTKAAEEKITDEAIAKIAPKDKEKIANLLRAAHGDDSAAERVKNEGSRLKKVRDDFKVGDYFDKERKPKNKFAAGVASDLEKKLGRPANYRELKEGLREGLAAKKPKGRVLVPDEATKTEIEWWKRKTDGEREEYLQKYPKSRFGKLQIPNTTVPDVDPVDNPATGRKPKGGTTPKDEKQGRNQRRSEQQENGYRAVALTLASLGLLVVGGAALVAAGVPLSVFTPELVKFVWRDLPESVSGKKNEELVGNLAKAIKSKFAKGNSNKELEDAMIGQGDSEKPIGGTDDEEDDDGNGLNPKRIPNIKAPKMPIRVRPFRPVPDKVRKPYSPARAKFGKVPTRR